MINNKFGLSENSLKSILSVLSINTKIKSARIYGSRAMGNYREGSDIDLVLIGDELSTTDLLKIENDLDDLLLPYKIDLALLHQIKNEDLKNHIKNFSVLIYSSQLN